MPVRSEIDTENGVVIRKVIGELTIEDIKNALVSTPQLAGFKPDMGAVWDYSEGTANFDTHELRKLAQFVERWSRGRGEANYRSAAFAPRDIDFGISRIYQALLEIHGVSFEFAVFRDLDQAIRWVNKTEPEGDINVPWLDGFGPNQSLPQNA